ncbi:hypothetical protein [Actinomadura hibisca]|uniref:hypothetical protein n=1 Tax=Actinomadura hibisca TaxID=68565 RepID=UPI000834657D|nr:hypothetical protein [Actinomadura hibisca]
MTRLRAVLVALALMVSLSGCELMQRISEGAYRNAVTDGVIKELGDRGVRLRARPECGSLEQGDGGVVRISCTATTAAGEPVRVSGTATGAETHDPRELYVITVGPREVLRSHCLGLGCARHS